MEEPIRSEVFSDGSFLFAFRLYSVTASTFTTVQQQWFFISPRKGASLTHTINITASGRAYYRILFKLGRGANNTADQKISSTLRNETSTTPNEKNGARTSIFYWKL